MKLFVTGATGYIGAHFVKVAAEAGHEVVATDFNMNQNDIAQYCSKIINWDIREKLTDYAGMAYMQKVDKVVHIAAKTKVPNSI